MGIMIPGRKIEPAVGFSRSVLKCLDEGIAVHDDDLVEAIGTALAKNRARDAFELADRLCRLQNSPPASHLVLKAIAARRYGLSGESATLLDRAMRADPTHLHAARLALDWLPPIERQIPAERILTYDDSKPHLLRAARTLAATGTGSPVFTASTNGILRFRAFHQSVGDNPGTLFISPAKGAPRLTGVLARRLDAGAGLTLHEIRLPRPPGPYEAELVFQQADQVLWSKRLMLALDPNDRFAPRPSVQDEGDRPVLNVIVPLYDDLDATKQCLASLKDQAAETFTIHTILVEDASPNPAIAALADTWGWQANVTVIRNTINLGFAGAVNRGLRACVAGDVVLLNADTVLPHRTMARLRDVARDNSEAGTLTPFTNNGQYTSFPTQYRAGPVPDGPTLEAIARAAFTANATEAAPLPSGIGFCLYIREAAMREVAHLSERYGNGYYEDVDLCLRISAGGWRNMCAVGVFVGHIGSRSFGVTKAFLVARNRAIVDRAFPIFASISAHYVSCDPLRIFRERIESNLRATAPPVSMTICGHREAPDLATDATDATTPAIDEDGRLIAYASLPRSTGGPILTMHNPAPMGLANLSIELNPETAAGVAAQLWHRRVERIVVTDLLALDPQLAEAFVDHGIVVDVKEEDAGLFCPRGSLLDGDGRHCSMPSDPNDCEVCVARAGSIAPVAANGGVATWRSRWARLVFNEMQPPLQAYQARWRRIRESRLGAGVPVKGPRDRSVERPRLALVGGAREGLDTRFLLGLCTALSAAGSIDCVVFGETLDDAQLMALPGVFVTGMVTPAEIAELASHYTVTHTMAATRRFALFDPAMAALSHAGFPIAGFDLFIQAPEIKANGSLYLPFTMDERSVTQELVRWMAPIPLADPSKSSGRKNSENLLAKPLRIQRTISSPSTSSW